MSEKIEATLKEYKISSEVIKAVKAMGFKTLTAVQQKTLPVMLEGHDIIAKAPTGTGKTVAFGIPMLEYINLKDNRVQELVICPTRELALQIADELTLLAKYIQGLRIAVLYGGQPISKQITQLKRKPQIIIGTPGRTLDHINRGNLSLNHVHTMVLDEADEMLNMGFVKDVSAIIEKTPRERQLVLFSATTNREVMTIAWKYLFEPVEIVVEASAENRPNIAQYTIDTDKKFDTLLYIIESDEFDRMIIFANTKSMTETLVKMLKNKGYKAECLNGDMKQRDRNKVMEDYRKNRFPILVATDVAARGIDVDDVEAVINYDLPNDNEYYVHRIGRTGRAKKYGVAFSLLTFREKVRMEDILKYIDAEPIKLHFDDMSVLVDDNKTPFFKNI